MISIYITACTAPKISYKNPETIIETPDTSDITDTPSDTTTPSPTVPQDERINPPQPPQDEGNPDAPPSPAGTPDSSAPNTAETPNNSLPKTPPPPSPSTPSPSDAPTTPQPAPSTGYVPTTNSAITNIPIRHNYTFLESVENEVLTLCNVERSKTGAGNLTIDNKLKDVARYKAMEMLQYNYFNHTSAVSGKSPFDLANSFGYSYNAFGENIQMSKGQDSAAITASYLVTNWMNSPGHRDNILNPSFKRMGIGVVFSSDNNSAYESQMFSN